MKPTDTSTATKSLTATAATNPTALRPTTIPAATAASQIVKGNFFIYREINTSFGPVSWQQQICFTFYRQDEKVCLKMRKCAKSWDSMRKSAKSWESICKCTKSWECLRNCDITWKYLRKCAKSWESVPKAEKV